jgi:hypothetical protein
MKTQLGERSRPTDIGARHAQQRDPDQQRPLAELKPAAFAFRRIGFRWLGFHRRIIPDRGQAEQVIQAAVAGQS